ncbi:MAG: hypothetical protein JOZ96_18515 [Acidobacteria bacterium]|nr:hypothetical protein [Acidobacteriota bacterium]
MLPRMSISAFLKARALSISDNIIAAILFLGGAIVAGWLTDYLAQRYGLTPKVAVVLSWSIGLLVFVALSLLLKPKKEQESQAAPAQQLNQSSMVNETRNEFAPHNEFKPHNEFNPTLIVNVSSSQPQAQEVQPTSAPRPAFKVTVPVTSRPGLVRMDVNLLRMAKPDEAGMLFPILVEFENLPTGKGKTAEVNDVWAHITYRDFDFMNAELARVGSGCWIDQPIPDVSFPLRTPRYLMLGGWHVDRTEPMVNEFRVFEYSRDLHRAVEKEVKIAGPTNPFVRVNNQVEIAQRRLVVDVVLTSNGHHDDSCEYQFQIAIFGGDGTGHSITCVKKP